ncbi:MAG: carbohydrate porin [Gammaproteobacteria bacterium]|nr:carbohydrate porin [Gammaproteobacteria bacterium]
MEKEHGFEVYWRLQLTHRLEFTPDLQVYLTPAKAVDNSRTIVFGLRLRYLL